MSALELDEELIADAAAPDPPSPGAAPPAGWKTDSRGRSYTAARGRKGTIYREHETQTVEEAVAADQARQATGGGRRRDARPTRSKAPKGKPPPPKEVDLREVEEILINAFAAPAMPCAMFGDVWAADHFTRQAPFLARNLVVASKTNPWLRRQLETLSTGGESAMRIMGMMGLAGACVAYAGPPVIHWFNLPVPDKAREMFGVPPRRVQPDVTTRAAA